MTVASSQSNTAGSNSASAGLRSALAEQSKAIDAAYEQYWELRQRGLEVDPKEFVARFPGIRTCLFRMLAVHHFVEERLKEDEPDWPMPGDTFGGFKLECELGRGGMAHVFKAKEIAVGNRSMVLKIAPTGNGEAATQGSIDHPNIVPVYSVATEHDSDLAAVCMPYLGRVTLQDVIEEQFAQPDPPRRAAAILAAIRKQDDASLANKTTQDGAPSVLRAGAYADGVRWLALQLAEALAFVHGSGICHQDLKPSNILMRHDGTPMLMDFNLATDLQTPSLRLAGTPAYMPPEHIQAVYPSGPKAAKTPDPRSDLYSFGVILYQLLTGKHPFGPLPAGMKAWELMPLLLDRQQSGFEPLWKMRPDADRALAGVVEACLSFDAEDRPKSAADIARLLRRGDGVRARAVRWLSRRRKAVAVACLLLASMAAAGGYHVSTRPPTAVAYAQLGDDAYAGRDFRLAVANYSESLRANMNQPDVLCGRGKAYLGLAADDPLNYGFAEGDFRAADGLQPQGKNKAFLAYCLHKQQATIAATGTYQEAIRAGFETAEVHNNLGTLHLDKAKFELADFHLKKALEMKPPLAAAHYNAAILEFRKSLRLNNRPAEQKVSIVKGINHVKEAAKLTPLTGGLAQVGGLLCANAARFDETQRETAIIYLTKAVDQGVDPAGWINDQFFSNISNSPRFQELASRRAPVGGSMSDTVRAVPIRDQQ